MLPGDKLLYIQTWQHAHHFTPRELEYLALNAVRLEPEHGRINTSLLERVIHSQLDEIWNRFEGWPESERVVCMTLPSGHPRVQAVLQN